MRASGTGTDRREERADNGHGPLRVGGIDYLNALPLTRSLCGRMSPHWRLTNHTPRELAERLRDGRLDVGLVPVVEYLARPEYRVVPGICVSSYGEVQSIRLYHRRPVGEVRVVGLDSASRTSSMLTRLLFRDVWGASPSFVEYPSRRAPDPEGMFLEGGEQLDAVLLIGDAALAVASVPGWEVLDLGTEWTRWTGLPFVYAFWVWRGGPCPDDLVPCLLAGKREGVSRVDEIAESVSIPGGFDSVACRHYLNRRIQYDLGPLQIEGCLEFFSRLERAGLIERAPSGLAFLSSADATCSTESA